MKRRAGMLRLLVIGFLNGRGCRSAEKCTSQTYTQRMSSQNSTPFHLATGLESALKTAAAAAGLDLQKFAPEVRAAEPRHGDFQANGAFAYAKEARANPREVANQVLAQLPAEVKESYEVALAGPGFINFTLKPAALLAWLRAYPGREQLATGASTARQGETW